MSDLAGRVFVVTGTASGIGARLALRLAERGASVIGVDIESDRGQEVCSEIRRQSGNSEVEFIAADVASCTEVRALAAKIVTLSDHVDVLINNAGIVESIRRVTAEGFERTLATHVLGPFLLSHLLHPLLCRGTDARIVNICSDAHRQVRRIDWDDLNNERDWRGVAHGTGFRAYSRAKLFQQMLTQELATRYASDRIAVHGVSPGYFVATRVYRNMRGLFALGVKLIGPLQSSVESAVRTPLLVATAPSLQPATSGYWHDLRPREPSPLAQDTGARTRLYRYVAAATGISTGD